MNTELYKNIVFNKFKKHFPEIDRISLEDKVNDYFCLKEMEKIYCQYCDVELKTHQPSPYKDSPSLDHKLPKSRGGLNTFHNIAITCTQCNIIKGTLTTEEYLKMLDLLSVEPEWKEKILEGIFPGRKANMLNAKSKKKKRGMMLSDFM